MNIVREMDYSNSVVRCLSDFTLVRWSFILTLTMFSVGCRAWNPNMIYKISASELNGINNILEAEPYKVQPGDRLSMLVYTNRGYKLVDAGLASIGGGQGGGSGAQFTYLVETNGCARFPMIDTVNVAGYTLVEVAKRLEDRYARHLVEPWVQIQVANRRAFVYRGNEQAIVVSLPNEQMTLLEVIALAGGIPATGKAYRIKLVRKQGERVEVFRVDLRDGTNLDAGRTIVQSNDVVLIDPIFETTLISQLTPFLALISSGLALYVLLRGTQR